MTAHYVSVHGLWAVTDRPYKLLASFPKSSEFFHNFIVRNLFPETRIRSWKVDKCEIRAAFIGLVEHHSGALIAGKARVIDHRKIIKPNVKRSPLNAGRIP